MTGIWVSLILIQLMVIMMFGLMQRQQKRARENAPRKVQRSDPSLGLCIVTRRQRQVTGHGQRREGSPICTAPYYGLGQKTTENQGKQSQDCCQHVIECKICGTQQKLNEWQFSPVGKRSRRVQLSLDLVGMKTEIFSRSKMPLKKEKSEKAWGNQARLRSMSCQISQKGIF